MVANETTWYIPQSPALTLTPEMLGFILSASERDRSAGNIFPAALRESIGVVARRTHIPASDVISALRSETQPVPQERIIYFGDQHGGSPALVSYLDEIADGPEAFLPDMVIFGGDLFGATKQRTIREKQLFYDNLMNRVNLAYSGRNDISASELLDYAGMAPGQIAESINIREGAIRLLQFALTEMGGKSTDDVTDLSQVEQEIRQLAITQMTSQFAVDGLSDQITDDSSLDEVLYLYIQWIRQAQVEANKKGLNSGTWVRTLPDDIRQNFVSQYEQCARDLLAPLLKLKEKGVEIVWIEGNEDSANNIFAEDLENPFNPRNLYEKECGLACQYQIGGRRGKASYHIWLPFFPLKAYGLVEMDAVNRLSEEVELARKDGLEIILVSHFQPDWSIHTSGLMPNSEVLMMTDNFHSFLEQTRPDYIVYSHQHNEIMGRPHPDATYTFLGSQTYFCPLNTAAELSIPLDRTAHPNQPSIRRAL